jgi:hypothetical protein
MNFRNEEDRFMQLNKLLTEKITNKLLTYDDPVRSIVLLKDYNTIVGKTKQLKNDTKKLSNLLEQYILANESELAEFILGDSDGYIYCEHAAEAVSKILSDADIKHIIQVGNVQKQSHVWILLSDSTIIDPTKSQFRNLDRKDYDVDIYRYQNR